MFHRNISIDFEYYIYIFLKNVYTLRYYDAKQSKLNWQILDSRYDNVMQIRAICRNGSAS